MTHSALKISQRTADNHRDIRDACPLKSDLLDVEMKVHKNHRTSAPSSPSNEDGEIDEEYVDDTEDEDGGDMDSRMDVSPFHLFRQQYEDARDRLSYRVMLKAYDFIREILSINSTTTWCEAFGSWFIQGGN